MSVPSNLFRSFLLTLGLVKQRGREGKIKGRREGREMINFFLSLVWFVREKWRATHIIGGSHHKFSLLSLIFLPIWEESIWWATKEYVSFVFLSFTPIPPKQTNEFISFPSLSLLFFPNPSYPNKILNSQIRE